MASSAFVCSCLGNLFLWDLCWRVVSNVLFSFWFQLRVLTPTDPFTVSEVSTMAMRSSWVHYGPRMDGKHIQTAMEKKSAGSNCHGISASAAFGQIFFGFFLHLSSLTVARCCDHRLYSEPGTSRLVALGLLLI